MKSLEQRHGGILFAGGAEDTQTILISDLSGVEAVRILFAGAAEDTQTMISDLKDLEQRHSGMLFAGGTEDTQTMISEARGGQVRSRIHKLDDGVGSDNE